MAGVHFHHTLPARFSPLRTCTVGRFVAESGGAALGIPVKAVGCGGRNGSVTEPMRAALRNVL
jgi:hypothetical protein